jgi:thiol-disulfide isomerase/thioredoxin
MKRQILFIAVALCMLSTEAFAQKANETWREYYDRVVKTGDNFSKDYVRFSAAYIDGTPVSSDNLEGVNVFYVFGGSTCLPCIALGKLMTLFVNEKKYDERDVRFVFITYDDEKGQKILTDKFGLNAGIIIHMPEEKQLEMGLTGPLQPTIVMADRIGKVVFKGMGFVGPDDMNVARRQFDSQFGSRIDALLEKQAKERE